jgi:hypothetical protein
MLLCISPTSPQYWSSTDAGVNIYFTGSNVGIGTATPAAKLDVSGDVLINGVTVGRGGGNIANNTANGSSALFYNTTGNFNVANGYQSLVSNTTGAANSANGANTLRQNTVGSFNTAN